MLFRSGHVRHLAGEHRIEQRARLLAREAARAMLAARQVLQVRPGVEWGVQGVRLLDRGRGCRRRNLRKSGSDPISAPLISAEEVLKITQSGAGLGAMMASQVNLGLEENMAIKDKTRDGELSEQQLDGVSGGQEVRKMETIVVTAKRLPPEPKVVKMETITVTAQRDKPDASSTRIAGIAATTKKN